ncbi:hypothetical protein FCM35_KLT15836 [Carex littledalei]|uniref:Uncharacterized protein n=1 Tax=Carex littledalei TaxID=544730 RepID=A0A833VSD7_9POAL|nr:hypothetical protein FCM35_KLT15836 [Carex littledalei]
MEKELFQNCCDTSFNQMKKSRTIQLCHPNMRFLNTKRFSGPLILFFAGVLQSEKKKEKQLKQKSISRVKICYSYLGFYGMRKKRRGRDAVENKLNLLNLISLTYKSLNINKDT